jgi:hypothetical protein
VKCLSQEYHPVCMLNLQSHIDNWQVLGKYEYLPLLWLALPPMSRWHVALGSHVTEICGAKYPFFQISHVLISSYLTLSLLEGCKWWWHVLVERIGGTNAWWLLLHVLPVTFLFGNCQEGNISFWDDWATRMTHIPQEGLTIWIKDADLSRRKYFK